MTGTVTDTFVYVYQPTWAWAYINGTWYRISPSAGADSVTLMFTQLVAARGTGTIVTFGLDSNNEINYVYY